MTFVQKESYKHKLAKQVLCDWLKEDYGEGKWFGDGVHMEYPLIPAMNSEFVGNVIGFNYSVGDERYSYYSDNSTNFKPTYEQCVANNDIPIAVLDIATVYKGCIREGFEVCHTHKVDNEKKRKIEKLTHRKGFKLYEIDAEIILCQIEKPKDIYKLCKLIINT